MEVQNALTQTLYAQLFEETLAYSVAVFEDGLLGSPYINTARGKRYLYWQVRQPDGSFKRQSLGPENDVTRALVEKLLQRKKTTIDAISSLKITTRAYLASGGMPIDAAHFKILEWLARHGLFRKGLIVVGSHAFAGIGNALGVRWGGALKTTDVDFARPTGIAIAVPDSGEHLLIPEVPQKVDDTFFEVPRLNMKEPSTSMMSRKSKVKVDFLTTVKTWNDASPHYFPDLAIAAEPLRFMDYLIGAHAFQGLLIGAYGLPVHFPDPARFAMHKLVIAQERVASFQSKVAKDINQAAEVIEALVETGRREEIDDAMAALMDYPRGRPVDKLKKSAERLTGVAERTIRSCLNQ